MHGEQRSKRATSNEQRVTDNEQRAKSERRLTTDDRRPPSVAINGIPIFERRTTGEARMGVRRPPLGARNLGSRVFGISESRISGMPKYLVSNGLALPQNIFLGRVSNQKYVSKQVSKHSGISDDGPPTTIADRRSSLAARSIESRSLGISNLASRDLGCGNVGI